MIPPAPRPGLRLVPPAPSVRRPTVLVPAAALVLLLGVASFFGVATLTLRGASSSANAALADVTATAEVATQLGDALETLYSYDFARLDENETAARAVVADGFLPEFERLFAQVRELAPPRHAVVSAVVEASAVQEIRGERAVLVAFVDQRATRAVDGRHLAAAGRLTVVGERVAGSWRIARVHSP